MGSMGGVVVSTLASHLCDPGSIPGWRMETFLVSRWSRLLNLGQYVGLLEACVPLVSNMGHSYCNYRILKAFSCSIVKRLETLGIKRYINTHLFFLTSYSARTLPKSA